MGRMPHWAKGRMRSCVVCGFWYPERDRRIVKIDNKWYCTKDIDSVTEKQRQDALKGR